MNYIGAPPEIFYNRRMTIFSGHDLTCVRAQRTVFENLSFCIESGRILALTGGNGTGKTSLLRVMAGLLLPASGALRWNGRDDIPGGTLHWIGPENALKSDLTVRENLEFWGAGMDTKTALSRLNMENFAAISVRYLSAGQRRRAALSRLFLSPRPLWLLDEPETGLDAESVKTLQTLVKKHANEGGIAVIATHRPELWGAGTRLEMGGAG